MINDKRLIEDFLPIKEISKESAREKSIRQGHISTLYLWWARRPLVACRAAVYVVLVPAPKEKNGRGPKSTFIRNLWVYPANSSKVKDAIKHIYEAHAERLSKELGKEITAKDIEEGNCSEQAVLASSIFLCARKREKGKIGSYENEVYPQLEEIVKERVNTLLSEGITGGDLVIACVGAGLKAFTQFERVEYARG